MSRLDRRLLPALSLAMALGSAWGDAAPAALPSKKQLETQLAGLGDPSYQAREESQRQLLEWGVAQPERILALLPKDPKDPEVQERCEWLRHRIPLEPMRRRMREKAGKDTELGSAVENLLERPAPDSLRTLLTHLKGRGQEFAEIIDWALSLEMHAETRLQMLAELEEDKSLAPQIAKLLQDPGRDVRAVAAEDLGWLGDKSFAPEVAKLLEDPENRVRNSAVMALGHLGDKSFTPRITKLLEDTDPNMRGAAARALAQLGEKSVAPQIAKLLQDPDENVRITAAWALARLGETSVSPEIAKLLEDPLEKVRYVAICALGQLGEKSIAPRIAKLLQDPDENVRAAAAKALKKLGTP